MTANELDLTAQFVGDVGIQLNAVCTLLINVLRFGVLRPSHLFPSVSIIRIDDGARWQSTCCRRAKDSADSLQEMDLCSIQRVNVPRLGQHIGLFSRLCPGPCVVNFCLGQLVSYMRSYGLKYGWLSTYYAKGFVCLPFRNNFFFIYPTCDCDGDKNLCTALLPAHRTFANSDILPQVLHRVAFGGMLCVMATVH